MDETRSYPHPDQGGFQAVGFQEVKAVQRERVDQQLRDTVLKFLRDQYPHGHPEFTTMAFEELALHSDKNHDYAKGGDPLGNFRRVAAILSLYAPIHPTPSVVALIYALKQLDAIFWGKSRRIQHKVEGLKSRYQDISVYAKLSSILHSEGE